MLALHFDNEMSLAKFHSKVNHKCLLGDIVAMFSLKQKESWSNKSQLRTKAKTLCTPK